MALFNAFVDKFKLSDEVLLKAEGDFTSSGKVARLGDESDGAINSGRSFSAAVKLDEALIFFLRKPMRKKLSTLSRDEGDCGQL